MTAKRRRKRKLFSPIYLTLVLIILYLPILMVIIYSFNSGRTIGAWQGFTTSWYTRLFGNALMADALILLAFYRMLSKNRLKRAQENANYLQKTQKLRRAVTEWVNRVKNSKKYRYFTCPKCKARLRVPRGVGSVTITCKSCGNKFDKKA